jgi:hypothetical protein
MSVQPFLEGLTKQFLERVGRGATGKASRNHANMTLFRQNSKKSRKMLSAAIPSGS